MSTPSIEGLPIGLQFAVYGLGLIGYAVAIAVAYFRATPAKKPEQSGSSITVAGALLSSDDADRIIGALHSNSRAAERLETCLQRNTDELQRVGDHLIAARRQI